MQLRTTNPIDPRSPLWATEQSPEEPGSRAAGIALAYKLIDRWRAATAPHRAALVRARAASHKDKLLAPSTSHQHRSPTAAVIGLGAFGLTTVTDAVVFVPDCIATTDPVCERLELTGHVSWQHLVHLGSSAASQIAIIVVALGIEHLATL